MDFTDNRLVNAWNYPELVKWIEGFGYASVCFLLPFVLGHAQNQLLLGSIVNAMIVLAAVRLDWKQSLPVILLPVLGVIAAGAMFGSLTPAVFYLVPFIWVGNALLVFSFKKLKDMRFLYRAVAGAVSKTVFIGGFTALLVLFGFVPMALLVPMSAIQIATGITGSGLAFVSLKAIKH